jgi:tetratricopeptide (TPR) repeat protein
MRTRFSRPAALLAALLALAACDSAEERVAQHYDSGMALLEEGAPEKAALEFRNAIAVDEGFLPARFELAKILLAQGNTQGAFNNFQRVVELDPAHAEARLQLANLLLLGGQFDEALTHADAASKAAPDDPDALVARAVAHYRLGNAEQALVDANRALELRPGDPQAQLLLVSEKMAAGDTAAALALVDQALVENRADLPLNLMKLQILSAQGADDAFGAHLEMLVGLHPENASLHQLLASWYGRNDRPEDVERALRRIQELQPDDLVTAQNLVRFLMQTQGEEPARAELVAQIDAAGARGARQFPFQALLADFDAQLGRTEEARALLEGVVASPPDEATANEARVKLARLALAEPDLATAKTLVDAVLAGDAKNAEALAIRAAILAEQDEIDAAVLDLRAALNEDPENVGLLRLAADIYERAGSPELAGESLASAVRLSNADPDLVLAYLAFLQKTGQGASMEAVLLDAVQRRPEAPQLLAALGSLRVQQQDWPAAERILATLRPIDATAADRLQAALLTGQGRTEEAVALLERMGELPGSGSMTSTIVQVYAQTGQRATAHAFLDGILADDPSNVEALRLRGALLQLDGDEAGALAALRAAIAADPADPAGYLALATLHQAAGRADEAEAVTAEGLAAVPDDPLLLLSHADLLNRRGAPAGALAAYEKLYAMRPDSVVAANNLASVLSEYYPDDPDKLARAAEVARRLAGVRSPQIQDTYGWILYLQGKPDEALRSLIPAAEGLPENPWVRYHIGMAYAALGQTEQARSHLEAALGLAEGQVFPADEIRAEIDRLGTLQ